MSTPSATVDPNVLATQYLKTLQVPVTPTNVQALATWFRYESQQSGKNIVVKGNNPLNITGAGPCGSWTSTTHTFKIYCTPQQGADNWSANLTSSWGKQYGYSGIATAFAHGNSVAEVLTAIANSGWVSGRALGMTGHTPQYGGFGIVKVTTDAITAAGAGHVFTHPTNIDTTLVSSTTSNPFLDALTALGISTDPKHIITPTEAAAIVQKLHPGLKENPLSRTGSLADKYSGKTVGSILGTDYSGVGGGPLDALGQIGKLAQNLADPKNWVKVLAIFAGGVVTLFGAFLLFNDIKGGGTAEGLVSPMPIILRGKV